ncbi:hypothetical protein ACUXHY_002902 [Cytobacillus horneckiae]
MVKIQRGPATVNGLLSAIMPLYVYGKAQPVNIHKPGDLPESSKAPFFPTRIGGVWARF